MGINREGAESLSDLDAFSGPQLLLVEQELLRQRELSSRKVGSTYTRASLLIGSAGILAGVDVGVGADGVAITIVSLGFYAVAAIAGLMALRPLHGDDVDVEGMISGGAELDEDELRRAIIGSNLIADAEYAEQLKNRTNWVVRGFIALVLAWSISMVSTVVEMFDSPPQDPVLIEIIGVHDGK